MMPLGFARGVFAQSDAGIDPTSSHNYTDNIGSAISALNANLNQSYSPTNSTHFSAIVSHIQSAGYTLVATPRYGAIAETLYNVADVAAYNAMGRFKDNVFRYDNYKESGAIFNNLGSSNGSPSWSSPSHLRVSGGFNTTYSQSAMDDHPFLCLAFWDGGTYKGTLTFAYHDMTSSSVHAIGGGVSGNLPAGVHRLYDLFYPSQSRNIYVHRIGPSSSGFFMGTQSTIMSHEAQFHVTHGTHSNGVFSADDGQWGFIANQSGAGGGSGDIGMGSHQSSSYGFENKNDNDTGGTAGSFYWGSQSSSTNYHCFVFTKFV
tara:strand:+ start:2079 stop:3029 length:951 start_codon:yes stop_codon:yes gene_type:complete